MYVYIQSEPGLYTVGFFNPSGRWVSESDHNDQEEAAKRVAWLNGGSMPKKKHGLRESNEIINTFLRSIRDNIVIKDENDNEVNFIPVEIKDNDLVIQAPETGTYRIFFRDKDGILIEMFDDPRAGPLNLHASEV